MDNVAKNKSVVRSSEVVGVKVLNNSEQNLGKIYEIVIDKVSGQVTYAVLESGAFLGLGGKFFTLPWRVLKYDNNNDAFKVNIDKAILEKAPGFDKDNWPMFSDQKWSNTINDYYSNLI